MSIPVNTVLPFITGNPKVGDTLRLNHGTWTGTAPITFTQQWLNFDGSDHNIGGETGLTYVVRAADLGKAIWVSVRGINVDSPDPGEEALVAHSALVIAATPVVSTALAAERDYQYWLD